MDCSARTVEVSVCIDGNLPEYGCSDDDCTDTSTSANAVQQVWGVAYRTWTGRSSHRYNDGAEWTSLPEQSRILNAGPSPQEECEAGGGQWFEDTCLYNPDGPGSPIIVNIGNTSKYKLTSAAEGVLFDLDGDGVPERIAWTEAGSEVAFLALDRDGDGRITSGKELFGNYTLPGVSNGFEALRRLTLQTNGGVERGSVSSEDPIFARLLLWTDANHNGTSESAELKPLGDVVSDVGLGYRIMPRRDGHGNQFRLQGWVHIRTAPGRNRVMSKAENAERTRSIWDVFLVIQR